MHARSRSPQRLFATGSVAIALLLSFASATAWAELHEAQVGPGATGESLERSPDLDRRHVTAAATADEAPAAEAAGDEDAATDGAEWPTSETPADVLGEAAFDGLEPLVDPASAPGVAGIALVTADDPAAARDRRVRHALEQWMDQHPDVRSVAVAVALTGPGGPTWSGAAIADGDAALLDHAATYPIMSVTKTFTEALVLRAAAEGSIDLDAPMPPIPDVAPVPDGVRITPRMLLQHSSGLVNYMNASGYDPSEPITPARAVSLSLGTPLLADPGTRTHYSNSNFHWLGLLLEHVTGRPYADLVGDLAADHGLPSATVDPAARPGWVGFASGGMRATLADVARWGAHLFTPGRVLSPRDLDAYRDVGALGVGLGIWPICPCTTAQDGDVDYTAIGQIVADGGVLYFPDHDVVVAVRLAHVPGDVGTITASVADAVAAAVADDAPVGVQ